MLLAYKKYTPLEWTVDKNAVIGDTVFFMCAKTSKDHMGHVCVQAKEESDEILRFAEKEKTLYKKYAGQIITMGKVATKPFQTEDSGWSAHYWKSPWYAEINEIILLDTPVDISQFREFINVSRTGAITTLNDEQYKQLLLLVQKKQ